MGLKLSFFIFAILHIFLTSADNASSYEVSINLIQWRGDFADFVNDKRNEEREVLMEINTNFNLQDKSQKICQGANIFRVCTSQKAKIGCKHEKLQQVRLGKNDNSSFATPGWLSDHLKRASFSLEPNEDTAKMDCYFCWIQVDGQSPTRSQAVIPSYHDCTEERQKVSRTLGSSTSLNCWDSKVKIVNATIEWYFTNPTGYTKKLDVSTSSNLLKFDINNVSNTDVGSYRCWIWFEKPKYKYARQFDLRILEPPEAPANVACSKTDQGLALKWTQVNTPNEVDTYKLEYQRLVGTSDTWTERSLAGNKNEFQLSLGTTERGFYVFRITAVNLAGKSSRQVVSCYFPD